MKKLVSGLVAALLLTAGLVATSTGGASATCKSNQYVPCENVKTKAKHATTVKRGKRPTAVITVYAPGNVKARGTLHITVVGPGVDRTSILKYAGRSTKFVGP